MGLIYDKSDVRIEFLKQWSKFVSAVLSYGENHSKRNVFKLVIDLDESGQFQGVATLTIDYSRGGGYCDAQQ